MTTVQRDAISNPAAGLIIYNTDIRCLDTYNGVRWITCNTIGATDVYNPTTGQVWMDRNLGATVVATRPRSDFNDNASYITSQTSSFGDLYQWGRATDGHEKRNSTATAGTSTSTSPGANFLTGSANWYTGSNPDDLWKEDGTGVNNPCPSGYRVPTEAEWDAERGSWTDNNRAGAFASLLKLPLAGIRAKDSGGLVYRGVNGDYWTSTISGSRAYRLGFSESDADTNLFERSDGLSVRCLKD